VGDLRKPHRVNGRFLQCCPRAGPGGSPSFHDLRRALHSSARQRRPCHDCTSHMTGHCCPSIQEKSPLTPPILIISPFPPAASRDILHHLSLSAGAGAEGSSCCPRGRKAKQYWRNWMFTR
jgi:hypothetical protein